MNGKGRKAYGNGWLRSRSGEDSILHLDLPVTAEGSGMGRDGDDPACRSPFPGKSYPAGF